MSQNTVFFVVLGIRYTISEPELQKKAHLCSCINNTYLIVFCLHVQYLLLVCHLEFATLYTGLDKRTSEMYNSLYVLQFKSF